MKATPTMLRDTISSPELMARTTRLAGNDAWADGGEIGGALEGKPPLLPER